MSSSQCVWKTSPYEAKAMKILSVGEVCWTCEQCIVRDNNRFFLAISWTEEFLDVSSISLSWGSSLQGSPLSVLSKQSLFLGEASAADRLSQRQWGGWRAMARSKNASEKSKRIDLDFCIEKHVGQIWIIWLAQKKSMLSSSWSSMIYWRVSYRALVIDMWTKSVFSFRSAVRAVGVRWGAQGVRPWCGVHHCAASGPERSRFFRT